MKPARIHKVVQAALRKGEITLQRGYRRQPRWVYGVRTFNSETIRDAIAAGYAVRIGNIVRAA